MTPITPTQYDNCIRLAEWLKASDSGDGSVVMPDGEKVWFDLRGWISNCGTKGCAVGAAAKAGVIPGLTLNGEGLPEYNALAAKFGGVLAGFGGDWSDGGLHAPPFYLESTPARTPTAVAEELRAWAEARRPEGR